jgi:uncharacterized protein
VIVVSNTSPLTNLAAIQQFDLLAQLYGKIYIPVGVQQELNAHDRRWPGSVECEQSPWVEVHQVTNHPLVKALQRDLDRGESEAIALAVEMKAHLVLMDEKEGRRLARRQGVEVMGVIGVLLQAKQQRLIEFVLPQLDALRRVAGFYMSDRVYARAGQLAGEL